jgi:hypothetical protein
LHNSFIFLLNIGIVLFLSGCNNSAKITGIIEDNFGQPLKNAKISIEDTTTETKSSLNGKYSINFVPGSFQVTYFKEGYTSITKNFLLTAPGKYPSEKIVLYKIPPHEGIYYIGKNDYVPIKSVPIIRYRDPSSPNREVCTLPKEEPTLINVPSNTSTLKFLIYKLHEDHYYLIKLKGNGEIGWIEHDPDALHINFMDQNESSRQPFLNYPIYVQEINVDRMDKSSYILVRTKYPIDYISWNYKGPCYYFKPIF